MKRAVAARTQCGLVRWSKATPDGNGLNLQGWGVQVPVATAPSPLQPRRGKLLLSRSLPGERAGLQGLPGDFSATPQFSGVSGIRFAAPGFPGMPNRVEVTQPKHLIGWRCW